MASEQARRDNVSDGRKVDVERDRVPKITTHFKSLADKVRDEQPHHGERVVVEAVPLRAAGIDVSGTAESEERQGHGGDGGRGHRREEMHRREGGEVGKQAASLEEISRLRGRAQQNSMEAIMAAEERYEKAKQEGGGGSRPEKGTAVGGGIHAGARNTVAGEGHRAKGQKAMEAEDIARPKGGERKDTTAEKGRQSKDVATSKGGTMIDTAAQKGRQAKDYTTEKAREAKDVTASKGGAMMDMAAEKAAAAKDVTAETAKTAAQYVGEMGATAKDATVESGRGVAAGLKDQAVVAGWGAAHYTVETAAEATKMMANATSKVGDVAVAAKEKVAEAGQAVAGYAAAAKDTVVATEESAAEFAARKREEAKRDAEMKKPSPTTEEEEDGEEWAENEGEIRHGIMRAIGETLVEIGQTTMDLVTGQRDGR